ncbi:hypothetical protein GJV85_04275 [Sulfurimonas aquatica]|uniref:Uncharacterized protein n=1 Tax=Sulfurimonas aquatica TaxID=2672570 RepID=A0A975AZF6_9BACT|nr:hypothetical protein [Sulfurimonas aquatica]QSZ41353.1 hypothetical protein GJV85_04275 [Sulfurimonas aquatica]
MSLRQEYPHEKILDRYIMSNKLIGESMPHITKSLREYMSIKDIELLESLLETVTIYRATSILEAKGDINDIGQSWTLDIKITQFFAYKNIHQETDRCVMTSTIKKEFIFAYIGEREESGCVVNYTKLENISYSKIKV